MDSGHLLYLDLSEEGQTNTNALKSHDKTCYNINHFVIIRIPTKMHVVQRDYFCHMEWISDQINKLVKLWLRLDFYGPVHSVKDLLL